MRCNLWDIEKNIVVKDNVNIALLPLMKGENKYEPDQNEKLSMWWKKNILV